MSLSCAVYHMTNNLGLGHIPIIDICTREEHGVVFIEIGTREKGHDYIILLHIVENRTSPEKGALYLVEDIDNDIGLAEVIANIVILSWNAQTLKLVAECSRLLKQTMCKINCHTTCVLVSPTLLFSLEAIDRDRLTLLSSPQNLVQSLSLGRYNRRDRCRTSAKGT